MLRERIIDRAVSYTRLESVSSEVIECLHIFDSRGWPSRELLMEYGTREIKTVFSHFNPDPEKIDTLLAEWVEYKFLFSKLTLKEALRRIVTDKDCQHRFPNLIPLLIFCAVLPVSTASCERRFSYQNRIKSECRNSLKTDTLDDLLTIAVNGPSLEEFNPAAAIDNWYFSAQRQRYTNSHQ